MPINFQQAADQIHKMGEKAVGQEKQLQEIRKTASDLLHEYAREGEYLRGLVERAEHLNSGLRCAVPTDEAMDEAVSVPFPDQPTVVLAADGSQINPDRHSPVEFGAINVGAIRMQPGRVAVQEMESELLFYEQLHNASGPLGDDMVALMRDLAERRKLVDLAKNEQPPVVTLTDGPLELYSELRDTPDFAKRLDDYLAVLEELADLGAATAGYVDKSQSDLVVRLLELVLLDHEGNLSQAGRVRPLYGVHDLTLFNDFLGGGQRSAVFKVRSVSAAKFSGRLNLHFSYLNVGRTEHPYLARVELPRWVVASPALLNLVQGVLLEQAAQLGARPYPYILHRAHEVAVVSFEERDQLETMIITELRRQGVQVGERSNKQFAKIGKA